jgi:hypothetical protein
VRCRCVSVRCTDADRCGTVNASVTGALPRVSIPTPSSMAKPAPAGSPPISAAVVDVCGAGPTQACGPGDVLLNTFAFRQLSGRPAVAANAFAAEWRFVPCAPWGSVYPGQASPAGAPEQGAPHAVKPEPAGAPAAVPAVEVAAGLEPPAGPPTADPGAEEAAEKNSHERSSEESQRAPTPTPAPAAPPAVEDIAKVAAAPAPEQRDPPVGADQPPAPQHGKPAWVVALPTQRMNHVASSSGRLAVNSVAGFQLALDQATAVALPEVLAFAAPPAPLAEVPNAAVLAGPQAEQSGDGAAVHLAPAQEQTSKPPADLAPASEESPPAPPSPQNASSPSQEATLPQGEAEASAPAAEASAPAHAAANPQHQGKVQPGSWNGRQPGDLACAMEGIPPGFQASATRRKRAVPEAS